MRIECVPLQGYIRVGSSTQLGKSSRHRRNSQATRRAFRAVILAVRTIKQVLALLTNPNQQHPQLAVGVSNRRRSIPADAWNLAASVSCIETAAKKGWAVARFRSLCPTSKNWLTSILGNLGSQLIWTGLALRRQCRMLALATTLRDLFVPGLKHQLWCSTCQTNRLRLAVKAGLRCTVYLIREWP